MTGCSSDFRALEPIIDYIGTKWFPKRKELPSPGSMERKLYADYWRDNFVDNELVGLEFPKELCVLIAYATARFTYAELNYVFERTLYDDFPEAWEVLFPSPANGGLRRESPKKPKACNRAGRLTEDFSKRDIATFKALDNHFDGYVFWPKFKDHAGKLQAQRIDLIDGDHGWMVVNSNLDVQWMYL